MRSVRIAEESWPLGAATPSVLTPASQDRTIFLDEPAASPVGIAGEDVTVTLTAAGTALRMTCAPGREATITVIRAGEVVLKQTIKL